MALKITWPQAAHCVLKQSLVRPLAIQLAYQLALVNDTTEAIFAVDLLCIVLHEASVIVETQRHCADCYINQWLLLKYKISNYWFEYLQCKE